MLSKNSYNWTTTSGIFNSSQNKIIGGLILVAFFSGIIITWVIVTDSNTDDSVQGPSSENKVNPSDVKEKIVSSPLVSSLENTLFGHEYPGQNSEHGNPGQNSEHGNPGQNSEHGNPGQNSEK